MDTFDEAEASIASLEEELGISVTIIDNHGSFHTPLGVLLFDGRRQSHQKNIICKHGFCTEKCVGHCRHQMNRKAASIAQPFLETCWKGISEIVIPFRKAGRHLGMFYAGTWRQESSAPAENLVQKFYPAYERLPLWESERGARLMALLQSFVDGLLFKLDEYHALATATNVRAKVIVSFIHERAEQPLELTDLAEHLHLSRSRTSYLLKKYFGRGFAALLHEERIRRAKTLLLGSDLPVAHIAELVGFSDEYYFNRVFRKVAGIPPGRFRRAHLTNSGT